VPVGTQLPTKPGCSGGAVESMVERAGEWIRELIH
jgi:hypothetical protein